MSVYITASVCIVLVCTIQYCINNINIVYIITSTIMYCVYISHHLYEFQYYMLYIIHYILLVL